MLMLLLKLLKHLLQSKSIRIYRNRQESRNALLPVFFIVVFHRLRGGVVYTVLDSIHCHGLNVVSNAALRRSALLCRYVYPDAFSIESKLKPCVRALRMDTKKDVPKLTHLCYV